MEALYVLSVSDGTTPPEFVYVDTSRDKCIELANRWCKKIAPGATGATMEGFNTSNNLVWVDFRDDAPHHHEYVYAIITEVTIGNTELFEMNLAFRTLS